MSRKRREEALKRREEALKKEKQGIVLINESVDTGIIQLVLWVLFVLIFGYVLTLVLLKHNIADPFAFKFKNIFDYIGSFSLILGDLNDILALRDGEFLAGLDIVLMDAFLGASIAGMICLGVGIGQEMKTVRMVVLIPLFMGVDAGSPTPIGDGWVREGNLLMLLAGFLFFIVIFLIVGAILGWLLPIFAIIHIIIGVIRK